MMEKILNDKWLKISLFSLLGLLLTISFLFAGYKMRQGGIRLPAPTTQNLTADWETYINQKYGYSIKHPRKWFALGGYSYMDPEPASIVFVSQQDNPPFIVEVAVEDKTADDLTNEELTSFVFGEHADRIEHKWTDIVVGKKLRVRR